MNGPRLQPTEWDRRIYLSPWWWPIVVACVVAAMIGLAFLLVGTGVALAVGASLLAGLSSWTYVTTMRILKYRQFARLYGHDNDGGETS